MGGGGLGRGAGTRLSQHYRYGSLHADRVSTSYRSVQRERAQAAVCAGSGISGARGRKNSGHGEMAREIEWDLRGSRVAQRMMTVTGSANRARKPTWRPPGGGGGLSELQAKRQRVELLQRGRLNQEREDRQRHLNMLTTDARARTLHGTTHIEAPRSSDGVEGERQNQKQKRRRRSSRSQNQNQGTDHANDQDRDHLGREGDIAATSSAADSHHQQQPGGARRRRRRRRRQRSKAPRAPQALAGGPFMSAPASMLSSLALVNPGLANGESSMLGGRKPAQSMSSVLLRPEVDEGWGQGVGPSYMAGGWV